MFGVFDTSDTRTADRPAGEPIVAELIMDDRHSSR